MNSDIPRHTRKCAQSGRDINPGDKYRSILRAKDDGYMREDFHLGSWIEPTVEPLAIWTGQLSSPAKVLNKDNEPGLFRQLENDTVDARLRFAAGSLLLASKALKLQGVAVEDGQEVLTLSKTRGKRTFRVVNPGLTVEELKKWEDASAELANADASSGWETSDS